MDLPTGDSLTWSGQYEYVERANKRLQVLVPITLAIIFLLLFLHLKSAYKSALLLGFLPLCIVGATWLMVVLPAAYMLIQRYCYRRQLQGNERERAQTTEEARGASLP
ncbi:efflux RND transporter permease subunit [Salinibacter altiplanensis]|uniref:efflux RND transporter permease subunit n=1 Tax=Salinibacter altiplanensis TaxID=1803181 RepID=UPI000C9F8C7A|nr:efflux RND transporter permease subunit [Salinibacter altiplanensis]